MLSEQIKELEKENALLRQIISMNDTFMKGIKSELNKYKECCQDVIPNQLFIHKTRGNTTIKFLSGKSVTVKRHKGDKDCLETAIAYCIMKSLLRPEQLRKLIKGAETHE